MARGATPREAVQLAVPPRARLTVSPEDFWDLCAANPELRLERTALGELIVMAPAGAGSGRRKGRLTQRLGNWADTDGTGHFFDSSAGFTLPNGAIRAPDVAWLLRERWNTLSTAQQEAFAPICPDFVVELLSPSERTPRRLKAARAKMREYLEQGARLGWLLDPFAEEVEIHRPGQPVEKRHRPPWLSGEDVLPGFTLDLHGILYQ